MSAVEPRSPDVLIRQLGFSDAAEYRELRLAALRDHPDAFSASWDEESAKPLSWFAARLDTNIVFGGWHKVSGLAGCAGLTIPASAKISHKGTVWGLFVRPELRGTGLSDALLNRVIAHAEGLVEELRLSAVAGNEAGLRLYERLGFKRYAVERRALKVNGRYHDEVLMARSFYQVRVAGSAQ